MMEIELRDYVAAPGRLDDWIRGWSDGVMPLRERCGFHLLGAWLDRRIGSSGCWGTTDPTDLTWRTTATTPSPSDAPSTPNPHRSSRPPRSPGSSPSPVTSCKRGPEETTTSLMALQWRPRPTHTACRGGPTKGNNYWGTPERRVAARPTSAPTQIW